MLAFSLLTAALSGVVTVTAAPSLLARQSITGLSSSQIAAFKPYSFFARAGYCPSDQTLTWSCGGQSSCAGTHSALTKIDI